MNSKIEQTAKGVGVTLGVLILLIIAAIVVWANVYIWMVIR